MNPLLFVFDRDAAPNYELHGKIIIGDSTQMDSFVDMSEQGVGETAMVRAIAWKRKWNNSSFMKLITLSFFMTFNRCPWPVQYALDEHQIVLLMYILHIPYLQLQGLVTCFNIVLIYTTRLSICCISCTILIIQLSIAHPCFVFIIIIIIIIFLQNTYPLSIWPCVHHQH